MPHTFESPFSERKCQVVKYFLQDTETYIFFVLPLSTQLFELLGHNLTYCGDAFCLPRDYLPHVKNEKEIAQISVTNNYFKVRNFLYPLCT